MGELLDRVRRQGDLQGVPPDQEIGGGQVPHAAARPVEDRVAGQARTGRAELGVMVRIYTKQYRIIN